MTNNNKVLLKLRNVSKFYYNKGIVASGFTKVNLEFNLGEFVAITGESGSGKSTLLNVLSGLDSYEEGEMYINGEETSHYSENDFEEYRKTYIGNIFQSFNLINSYSVYQNIELVLLLNGYKKSEIKTKIIELIKKVDLYKYRNIKVSRLSGGQKQRVAIARALAKDTPIIIADEPTGNLDSKSAKSVIELLASIAKDKLVIVVTHNYEQVEKYVTRKIEMHDGKVREDINLKEYKIQEPVIYHYKNITFFNKIRIGVRNTFNILSKYILTLFVFFFVVAAFLITYSGFREAEYEESKNAINTFFKSDDDTRIVINKKDGSYISNDDFNKIQGLPNVKNIVENDTILDTNFILGNNDYSFSGFVKNIDSIKKVDKGRMPKDDNEVVIEGNEYNQYLNYSLDDLFKQELSLNKSYGSYGVIAENLKVVGVVYTDSYDENIYLTSHVLNKVQFATNERYGTIKITTDSSINNIGTDDEMMRVAPSKKVEKGNAIVDDSMQSICSYNWCLGKKINIKIENIYYTENVDLNVTNLYTMYNYEYMTGYKDYDISNNTIYISEEDYNYLYNKNTYQSSVYADDIKNVDELAQNLENMGYKAFLVKNTLFTEGEEILKILKIFKLIVMVILFIVMFFIAYFVIRLIQKSKNVYYATVRILGGSKRVIKNFISIELLTVFNTAYLIVLFLIFVVKKNILKINFLKDITKYLLIKDYIIIYTILFVMSYFISLRYARKLFKSSAMKTYREEV